jgi:hypothetical protein
VAKLVLVGLGTCPRE